MEQDQEQYKVREPKLEPPADANRSRYVKYGVAEEEGRGGNSQEGQDPESAGSRLQREELPGARQKEGENE
ncbi:MAG: hypothetical protein EOO11_04195 [Chitinophagaceae bacterium]|nr:MAG: hypothetical protein EOO11_04195 [Chitinophagaceae bacterium]